MIRVCTSARTRCRRAWHDGTVYYAPICPPAHVCAGRRPCATQRYQCLVGSRHALIRDNICAQEKFRESGVADKLAPVTTAASETKTLFSQVCVDACAQESATVESERVQESPRERMDAHQSNTRRRERARESLGAHESRRIMRHNCLLMLLRAAGLHS